MNGGYGQRNEMTLCLLSNPVSACNITMVGFEYGDTVVRGCWIVRCYRHTGPAPSIMVWGGIGFHYHTPLVGLAGTLNSQRYMSEVLEPFGFPIHSALAISPIPIG
ncbi:transposable element Tcb1 transposase [Trichonephila clavipes]|nr:transposable element Tcb1 transposase [Trichonephila clavipes]